MRPPLLCALLALAVIAVGGATGCGSDGDGGDGPRAAAVDATINDVVVPGYAKAAADLSALAEASDRLCSGGDQADLDALRLAWRTARTSWKRTEAYWLAPVMDRRSLATIDWPSNATAVDEALAGRSAFTPADVGTLSTSARGLGAIEELIFPDDVLISLPPVACQYVTALAGAAAQEGEAVARAWAEGDGETPAAADIYTGEGEGAIDTDMAISELIERLVFLTQTIADRELDRAPIPGDPPQSGPLPEGPAAQGALDLDFRLRGIFTVLEGRGGPSFADLLSGDLRTRLEAALAAADEAAQALEGRSNAPARLKAAATAVAELRVIIATEVVSELGATVGFSDNDGDSG